MTNPWKVSAKGETQTMNATFGKKFDFDFTVSFFEEPIPSDSNAWNHWTGNGNSGMDAVAHANGIDETQLSNGHRKRPKERTRRVNLIGIRSMECRNTLS